MPIRSFRKPCRLVLTGTVALGALALAAWAYRENQGRHARAGVDEARALLARGKPARALQAVSNLSAAGPWGAELLTTRGLALAALDRPGEARPVLERALKLDPSQPMAAKVLAAVYLASNQPERGLALLAQAARLEPDDFRPWFAAGNVLLRQNNQPESAAAVFKEALRRRPDHVESGLGLVEALLTLGRLDEAAPLLDQFRAARPGDLTGLKLATRLARLRGDAEAMNRLADEVLAVDPDEAEANATKAQYLLGRGQAADALACAERAVSRAPADPAALHALARAEAASGLKERSIATSARHREALARLVRLDQLRANVRERPDDPEPLWKLGREAAGGGMTNLALNSYRAALSLDPNCAPARDGLAALRGNGP